MSMYQGLDLSRFKKISANDKTSTLRHSKGHELRIAHSSLSPQMRDQIANMPVHLAEGGDPVDPDSPAEVGDAPEVPDVPAPSAAPQQPDNPSNEYKRHQVHGSSTVDVNAAQQPVTAQDLDNEDALAAQDMARGHIKPETMADLYGKKDTLGKIGTLFGLMIGGAGAGLSHQPNALLGMMQKEIDNDFEAQKASNSNAQNWLKLSHEHQMQKAQLKKMGVENEYTRALTGKVPSDISVNQAHIENMKADTKMKAATTALNLTQLGAYQHLKNITDKMSPGPDKDKAVSVLQNEIGPSLIEGIKTRNQQLVDKLKLREVVRGDAVKAPPAENPAGVDFKKLNVLAQQGQMAEKLGMPGGMRGADVSAANEEAKRIASNRAIAAMYKDSFDHLDKMALAGKLNPQMRDAEITSLVANVSRAAIGTFNKDEQTAMANSMLPSATDFGRSRDEKFRKTMEHFKSQEADTPTLDRFDLKTPFPEYGREKTKNKSPEMIKISGGKKYKRGPNGEAIEVK